MYTVKQKKAKKPISLGRKIVYAALLVALVIGLIYGAYYLIHYYFYDEYKNYLSGYEYEEGTELVLGSEKLEGYDDYKLVCESDTLKMYLDTETSNVAIYDKRSGVTTFAAPPDADDDSMANAKNISYLKSHLIVTYFNASRTTGTYDSYSMAVERDQVTYEAIENGVRVIYDMGDYSNTLTIPLYLSNEKFDEICTFLDESEAKSMDRYYSTTSDVSGMRQLLSTAKSNRIIQNKIEAMLEKAGFTEEDYVEQMTLAGVEATVPISFEIPLEYRLEGDHIEVSIPVCAIEEKGGGALYKIELLRNFGAAGTGEEGYIVVPNGDGSIINFNNGKTTAANYTQYIYGIDPLAADYTLIEASSNAAMALYGLCKEDATILATIEDGASLAAVTAGVSGRINSYNYVYTTFVVRGSETLEMFGTTGNEATLPIVEPDPYDSMLTVRYSFMDEDHTGYSGIANYYRDRLIEAGVLTVQDAQEADIKFYYDVIAGLEMTESFLGKQYMGLTAMTTFEEAQQMAQLLSDAGITNQVMNLQGWCNGGYYHEVLDYIWVNWKLGGKSGLEALDETLEALGGSLYADVAFQKVTYDSKRFSYQTESSKYYASGYAASFGQVNPVTLRQTSSLGYSETCYDLISPKFLVRYVGAFADSITDYDIGGISLRDLGSTLQSDKKRTGLINREEALDVVIGQLELLADTGKSMLVNQANDYAWSVADDILNLPLSDNEYVLVDYDIPLYEMIVHGCIDYCGGVYNLTDVKDDETLVLTMLEYGAAPHFVFTWEDTSEMKYSGLNSLYSTTFSVWCDKAASVYQEVNECLRQVSGATVTEHRIVSEDVRTVTYSNGVTIYVNYGAKAATVDGVSVPALGYTVK